MDFLLQWLIPEGISHDHDLNHLNSFWKIWSDSCRTNISFFLAFRVLVPLDGWNLSSTWWNSAYLSRKWCRWPRSIGQLSQATFPHFYSSVYISLSHFSYLQFELCRCTHHLWARYPLNQGRRQLRLTSSQGTWLKPRDGATSSAVNHRSMAQLSRRHRQRQKSGSVGWCCWCINCIIWFNQQRKNQLSLILLEVGCIWLYDVIWNHPN